MSETEGRPKGWSIAKVGSLVDLTNGFPFKPSHWKEMGLPIIRIQNLNNPEAKFNYCPDSIPEKYRVREGDLLFAWSGTPGTSFGAHIWRGQDAWLNQHIFRVDFNEDHTEKRFLRYALNYNLEEYIRAAHGGAGLAHITKGIFEESEILIPPLHEQRRIVAKIEELLSDLDAGVVTVERVRANLKRYRAAVLKAAVEGKLTEDWRAQHPDTEPASVLLERILTERRRQWEQAQLAKFSNEGKQPLKGWREKYPALVEPEANFTYHLPAGWCWASLSQLGELDRGRSRHRPRNAPHLYGGSYPFVQTGDIRHARTFVREYSQTYSEAGLEQSRLWQAGTLCITIAANIAETAILGFDACFPDSVVGFLADHSHVSVRYTELYLRTVQSRLESIAPATAQKNINIEVLTSLPVILPPRAEQEAIVAEVDRRLSIVDEIEGQVDANLKRAARLRQGILKRAFEGRLVPQDPNDEPAEKLLKRIRQQRQPATKTYNGRLGSRRARRPRRTSDPLLPFPQDDGNGQGGKP